MNDENVSSSVASLKFGLPQGSILSPTLFALYMSPLGFICQCHDILYLPLKIGEESSLQSLLTYLEEVKILLAINFLQLNERKSEIFILGPQKSKEKITRARPSPFRSVSEGECEKFWCHYPSLSFEKQINLVVRSFYQLKMISKLKPKFQRSRGCDPCFYHL